MGELLRRQLPEPPLPAGFARSVLRRIHDNDMQWLASLAEVVAFLKRPVSLGLMSMALAAGAWGGFSEGMRDARLRAERAHVLAIDPETSAFAP